MGAEFAALWLESANGQRWQRGHGARMAARNRTVRANAHPVPVKPDGPAAGEGAGEGAGEAAPASAGSGGVVSAYLSGGLLAAGARLLGGGLDGDDHDAAAAADALAAAPPREGEGLSFAFPNGDFYKGGWRGGLRHGYGVGSLGLQGRGGKYEGDWRGDLWHGEGVFTSGKGACKLLASS